MKVNVGIVDRTIRIIFGLGILALFFILEGNARYLGLIGIVPLLTAAFRSCPLYSLLGVSSCPTRRET
jgi:hypothetical protein